MPDKPTIVADITVTIGPDSGAIGTAIQLRNHLNSAIQLNSAQGAAFNLNEDDSAICHGNGTLGEFQASGDLR